MFKNRSKSNHQRGISIIELLISMSIFLATMILISKFVKTGSQLDYASSSLEKWMNLIEETSLYTQDIKKHTFVFPQSFDYWETSTKRSESLPQYSILNIKAFHKNKKPLIWKFYVPTP